MSYYSSKWKCLLRPPKTPESPETTTAQNSPVNHCWARLTHARQQRCSLVRQLAEGYSSVVSWLSCYRAVNSGDGSCLCVLIRSVTLNLSIDTWGVAERGKAAIYRASIMTFIDDVTTGAHAFETHKQFAEGFNPFVCTLKHKPSKGFQSWTPLNGTLWACVWLCVFLRVCVSPLTVYLMSAVLLLPRQMVHWTMSLEGYSWPLSCHIKYHILIVR